MRPLFLLALLALPACIGAPFTTAPLDEAVPSDSPTMSDASSLTVLSSLDGGTSDGPAPLLPAAVDAASSLDTSATPETGATDALTAPDASPYPPGCAARCFGAYVADCAGGAYCCTLDAARTLPGCQ
jgi:hypothetical protein